MWMGILSGVAVCRGHRPRPVTPVVPARLPLIYIPLLPVTILMPTARRGRRPTINGRRRPELGAFFVAEPKLGNYFLSIRSKDTSKGHVMQWFLGTNTRKKLTLGAGLMVVVMAVAFLI